MDKLQNLLNTASQGPLSEIQSGHIPTPLKLLIVPRHIDPQVYTRLLEITSIISLSIASDTLEKGSYDKIDNSENTIQALNDMADVALDTFMKRLPQLLTVKLSANIPVNRKVAQSDVHREFLRATFDDLVEDSGTMRDLDSVLVDVTGALSQLETRTERKKRKDEEDDERVDQKDDEEDKKDRKTGLRGIATSIWPSKHRDREEQEEEEKDISFAFFVSELAKRNIGGDNNPDWREIPTIKLHHLRLRSNVYDGLVYKKHKSPKHLVELKTEHTIISADINNVQYEDQEERMNSTFESIMGMGLREYGEQSSKIIFLDRMVES